MWLLVSQGSVYNCGCKGMHLDHLLVLASMDGTDSQHPIQDRQGLHWLQTGGCMVAFATSLQLWETPEQPVLAAWQSSRLILTMSCPTWFAMLAPLEIYGVLPLRMPAPPVACVHESPGNKCSECHGMRKHALISELKTGPVLISRMAPAVETARQMSASAETPQPACAAVPVAC